MRYRHQQLQQQMQRRLDESKMRLDASESIFFERELASIDTRMFEVKFPILKGRYLVPRIDGVGETDDTYLYRQYESFGKADFVAPGATDLPKVQTKGEEFSARIKPIAASYGYDLMEIRRAAAVGRPLNDMLARAAMRAHEEKIDALIAFGSAADGMKGFANHASVDKDTFVPGAKAAGGTTWLDAGAPNATAAEMVLDVNAFVALLWGRLKEAEGLGGKLTIVIPAAEFAYLATAPMGDNADKTAYKYLVDNNPFIAEIVPWHKLDGAGDGGLNRMIAYVKDPMVLGSLIPMEYSPQPYQQKGLYFEVPTLTSCGGTVFRYPICAMYGDGI